MTLQQRGKRSTCIASQYTALM